MRFDYLHNRSEKCMTSFFSANVLSATRICIGLLTICLICSWPVNPFFRYTYIGGTPLTFPILFVFSLIYVSHFHLACGKGEYLKKQYWIKYKRTDLHPMEKTLSFFTYSLPGFILHTLFIHFILLPLFILSAVASGINLNLFWVAVIVLVISAFIARLIGFLTFLMYGYWSLKSFLISRGLFSFYFFLSGLIVPAFNPIYIIYKIYKQQRFGSFDISDFHIYLSFAIGLMTVLIIFCQILILNNRKKRKTESRK